MGANGFNRRKQSRLVGRLPCKTTRQRARFFVVNTRSTSSSNESLNRFRRVVNTRCSFIAECSPLTYDEFLETIFSIVKNVGRNILLRFFVPCRKRVRGRVREHTVYATDYNARLE